MVVAVVGVDDSRSAFYGVLFGDLSGGGKGRRGVVDIGCWIKMRGTDCQWNSIFNCRNGRCRGSVDVKSRRDRASC